MAKTYILDTNVLLHDPNSIFAFQDNDVVIPLAVVEEIDAQKKRQDEIGRNARSASRILDQLRSLGKLSKGVPLRRGGCLRVEVNHLQAIQFPQGLDPERYDNRILALAHNLNSETSDSVTLVTKDLNLRIKADVMGIHAEDFYNDKVDYDGLYRGFSEVHVTDGEMDLLYKEKRIPWDREPSPDPHEFLILKNLARPSQSALAKYHRRQVLFLNQDDSAVWGVRPRNKEQRFSLELLLDDAVKVVTLVGSAGTGKTLLALAVGLDKVLERRLYKRLLIIRPVVPMGDDLGYLPGSKEEKLRPWMQPIYDNLEYLFRDGSDTFTVLDEFVNRGVIEMETLTHIRGRSIPHQFIICDEAQNLSPNMIKTLVTRVGEGTKIVFTGDPEQIDHPYLDASSNGLTYLVERLKGEEISGHITLTKGERSVVAEMGARLL